MLRKLLSSSRLRFSFSLLTNSCAAKVARDRNAASLVSLQVSLWTRVGVPQAERTVVDYKCGRRKVFALRQ